MTRVVDSNGTLTLFLNQQIKDFGDCKKGLNHQNLSCHKSIRIIKTHKKLHHTFLLLVIHPIIHSTTVADGHRLEVLQFIPKDLEACVIGINV